jgi:hypothetical protein
MCRRSIRWGPQSSNCGNQRRTRREISATLLLPAVAVIEGATGVALILLPAVVISLLLGTNAPPIGRVLARFAGTALTALSLGCWLERRETGRTAALWSMLLYNVLATQFFVFLALRGEFVGPLLWPALAIHAVASLLLGAVWRSPLGRGQ